MTNKNGHPLLYDSLVIASRCFCEVFYVQCVYPAARNAYPCTCKTIGSEQRLRYSPDLCLMKSNLEQSLLINTQVDLLEMGGVLLFIYFLWLFISQILDNH